MYMYHGVELSKEKKVVAILVGYFDHSVGRSIIRLLDVVHENSRFLNCIEKTLKIYKIPLANLASFYSNTPNTTELISDLKNVSPCTIVLCSLRGIADEACHRGIEAMKHSNQIQELLKEVQQHFLSFPSSLKQRLCDLEEVDITSLLTNCLLLRTIVHEIALAWSDLVQYFSGQDSESNTKAVCCLLSDKSLRLCFLFLSHGIQPLSQFQEGLNQHKDASDVLQSPCSLLDCFVTSYLQPNAVKLFLRDANASTSNAAQDNLPRDEIKIGKLASTYVCQNDSEFADCLELFYKSVVSFYAAVSSTIATRLPLPDSALKTIVALLSPEFKTKVTGKTLADLGVKLGVCTQPFEISLLTEEFLDYISTEREVNHSNVPGLYRLDQYWKEELSILQKTSFFRKLILKLLSLPKSLNKENVFTKVGRKSSHVYIKAISGLDKTPASINLYHVLLIHYICLFLLISAV